MNKTVAPTVCLSEGLGVIRVEPGTLDVGGATRVALEHGVAMGGLARDYLQHVPVFDDLAVLIKTEDINAGPVFVCVRRPFLVAMLTLTARSLRRTLESINIPCSVKTHSNESS